MKGFIKNKFEGQKQTFDVTVPIEAFGDYRELAAELKTIAKHWAFQHEKGETSGYEHWQVRLSLHKKQRFSTFASESMPHIPGCWSVTTLGVHEHNQFNYVMKAQTRVAGPWTDKDENLRPPPIMTDQLLNFLKQDRYSWQNDMEKIATSYDERHLHYVYDPHYHSGKSVFCEYLEYKGLAEEIPPFTQMEDIMQFVMSMPTSRCYLFDMPAAMKKDKVHQLYSGLEMLKNGFLYDKRYCGKKRRISRPVVILFANNLPQSGLIAPDRLIVWYLTPDKRIVRYDQMSDDEKAGIIGTSYPPNFG